jgi:hypothetical protein
MVDILADQ